MLLIAEHTYCNVLVKAKSSAVSSQSPRVEIAVRLCTLGGVCTMVVHVYVSVFMCSCVSPYVCLFMCVYGCAIRLVFVYVCLCRQVGHIMSMLV